jgi:hypothetical protein
MITYVVYNDRVCACVRLEHFNHDLAGVGAHESLAVARRHRQLNNRPTALGNKQHTE